MKDQLIYPVADMLNLPMHEMPDGLVRGAGARTLRTGGWQFEAEMVVASDTVSDHEASYFARLHANIWLYIVVRGHTNSAELDTLAYAFDAKHFDLKAKDVAKFGAGSTSATLKKLAPAITAVFEFRGKTNEWKALDATDMVEPIPA